jgi:hypothetical protein
METKDGLDIRRSRCYVLQINNVSGVIVDSRVSFSNELII